MESGKYDVNKVVPLLLKACPSLEPDWKKHLEWWKSEDRGVYNDMAEIAHIVVDLYKQNDVDDFPGLFEQAEELIREGNAQVKNLMIVGLLEGMRNVASHESFGREVFIKWFGPLSMKGWKEVEETWKGKASLADVVRAEMTSKGVAEYESGTSDYVLYRKTRIKSHHRQNPAFKITIGGKPMPMPAELRIVQLPPGPEYLLLYMDKDGQEMNDGWGETIEAIIQMAEFEYGVKPDEWVTIKA